MKVFHVQILGRHYYVKAESKEAMKYCLDELETDAFNNTEGMDPRLVDSDYIVTEMHICDMDCFVHEWL